MAVFSSQADLPQTHPVQTHHFLDNNKSRWLEGVGNQPFWDSYSSNVSLLLCQMSGRVVESLTQPQTNAIMHWCSFFDTSEWKISSQTERVHVSKHQCKLYQGFRDAFISLKKLGSVCILSFQWNVWSNVEGDGQQQIWESAVHNTRLSL